MILIQVIKINASNNNLTYLTSLLPILFEIIIIIEKFFAQLLLFIISLLKINIKIYKKYNHLI